MRKPGMFVAGMLTGMSVSGGALALLSGEPSARARISFPREMQSVNRMHKGDRLKPLIGGAEKPAPSESQQPKALFKSLQGCEPAMSTILSISGQRDRCLT